MRIAYLADSIIPSRAANSIHVMKMCAAFMQNGHDVSLLVPNRTECERDVEDIFAFYGTSARFHVEKLPWFSGVRGHAYLHAIHVALKAKKLQPDLVYGRALYPCMCAAHLGLPIVYESHTPPREGKSIKSWLENQFYKNSSLLRVVVISEVLKRIYADSGKLTLKKIAVAHDAADRPVLCETPVIGDKQKLQVGYVGHLYPGRGIDFILDAAKTCPWADFHVIGGTDADVEYWKRQVNGVSNLHFYGFIPPAETDCYRQACDVLLAPYQHRVSIWGGQGNTAEWMSPLKVFEYMAAGKAIICSDLPVLREVLEHEKTALLCIPDVGEAWIDSLKRLHEDVDLRYRLGKNAQREWEARYTWSVRAKNVLDGLGFS